MVRKTQASSSSSSNEAAWQSLRVATWLSLLVHLVAGLAMLLVLRHGLVTNPDFQVRLRFLAERSDLWTAAWLIWHVAAFTLLFFYYAMNRAHETIIETTNGPGRVALMICAAGIAADLAAQAILIGVVPDLARAVLNQLDAVLLLQTIERTALLLSGYLANGLYTLAALLLVISTRQTFPAWVVIAGGGVVAGGAALSVATLANSVAGLFWSNSVLVPSILLWQGGILLTIWRPRYR